MSVDHPTSRPRLLHPVPDADASSTQPPQAVGSDTHEDGLAPVEVLAVYGRQADELAHMVEMALADEDAHYREQSALLAERHRRRVALLTTLADQLGEKNAQLDEVAHALAGGS